MPEASVLHPYFSGGCFFLSVWAWSLFSEFPLSHTGSQRRSTSPSKGIRDPGSQESLKVIAQNKADLHGHLGALGVNVSSGYSKAGSQA